MQLDIGNESTLEGMIYKYLIHKTTRAHLHDMSQYIGSLSTEQGDKTRVTV